MPHLCVRWICAALAGFAVLLQTGCSNGILVGDAKSQPESLTLAPDGTLIVGSASSPFIYRIRPGSKRAEKFIDASSEGVGTHFLGMLADAATNTLWACEIIDKPGTAPVNTRSVLRSFDLTTGSAKLRWQLPDESNLCNDFSVAPDKSLYISDTLNGRIYRLPADSTTGELFVEDPALSGIDGITFLNGTLYVDNLFANKLYRIPIDNAGKAGQPVNILLGRPINKPDGMRASNGKLLLAESGSGQISVVSVNGDKADVTTIKRGLWAPTGVEPAGAIVWIAERGTGRVLSVPMPK
jgi:hypothetical protein